MRIEDQLVLELCKQNKNSLIIKSLVKNTYFDINYFLKIINNNLIAPTVFLELLKFSIPPSLKKNLYDISKKTIIENTLHNQLLKKELSGILKHLNNNRIESVLMKGLSLDFTGFRINRDIDILINQNDLIKAIEILKAVNYKYIGDIINYKLNSREKKDIRSQFSWNNQYQLMNESNGLLLELHTNLFERKKAYNINLDALLDKIDDFHQRKVRDKDLHAFKFCNEDLLLLICMHNAIKKSLSNNTFILRNLIDIENLAGDIDWGMIMKSAKKYNISSFIYFSLSLSKLLLNTNIPDNVIIKLEKNCSKKQLFIEKIHIKCFHSLESSSIFFSNLYKILAPFIYSAPLAYKIKHILLIHIFFPSKIRMAELYNIRYNNPLIFSTYIINPFRWIYLIIKNNFK